MSRLLVVVIAASFAACECGPAPAYSGPECSEMDAGATGGGSTATGGGTGVTGGGTGVTGGGTGATGGGTGATGGGTGATGGGTGVTGGGTGATGGGTGNPCDKVTCTTPPSKRCMTDQTLRTYEASGVCDQGTCRYTERFETCQFGCQFDACVGNPCQGVTCTTPPAAACVDSTTLKRFSSNGTCAGGACSYTESRVTCPFGCANGACVNDPCAGVACTTPPATFCLDANTTRSFSTAGTCSGGGCVYAPIDTSCPFGCQQGACRPNPCQGVTCSTPPANTCIGSTARTYALGGTCGGNGQCSYSYVDTACASGCANGVCNGPVCGGTSCNQPPVTSCTTAKELRTYARVGDCDAGNCQYEALITECSTGCLNGACLNGSWRRERIPNPAPLYGLGQLVLDPSDQPHLIGCTSTGAGGIEHRWRDESGWHLEQVDPGVYSPAKGCFARLAIDSTGKVMATWFDGLNEDLRFGTRGSNGVWQVELVKGTGSVGWGATMLLESNGSPILAAQDGNAISVFTKSGSQWSALPVIAATPGTSLSFKRAPNGDLGLLAGINVSKAVPGGNWYQPPAKLALRRSGVWTEELVTPNGVVGVNSLAFTDATTNAVVVGIVGALNNTDRIWFRARSTSGAATEAAIASPSNLRDYKPSSVFVSGRGTAFLTTSNYTVSTLYQLRDRVWEPMNPSVITQSEAILDAVPRSDGHLVYYLTTGVLVVPPRDQACAPRCTGATCGDDGCGGSCGTCSTGSTCSAGACVGWRIEPAGPAFGTERILKVSGQTTHLFSRDPWVAGPKYATKTAAGPWVEGPTALSAGGAYRNDGLVVDSSGRPVIASQAGTSVAISSIQSDGGWGGLSIPGFVSGTPAMVARSGGRLDVVSVSASGSSYNGLTHASFDGGSWTADSSSLSTAGGHSLPGLTVDAQGRLVAAFNFATYAGAANGKLNVAVGDLGSWTKTTPFIADAGTNIIGAPVVVRADSTGTTHVLFNDGRRVLYGKGTQASWSFEVVPGAAVFQTIRMELTPSNEPVIVFEDQLVRRVGAQLVSETLPISGSPGLAIGADGVIHLSGDEGTTPVHLWR